MKIYARAVKSLLLSAVVIALAIFITPHLNQAVSVKSLERKASPTPSLDQPKNIRALQNTFKEEVLAKKGPVTVVFFATWCPSCTAMKPIIHETAQEFKTMPFVFIDVDEFQDIANNYGIQAIPAFLFFKDGKHISGSTGFMEKKVFVETLRKHFGNA